MITCAGCANLLDDNEKLASRLAELERKVEKYEAVLKEIADMRHPPHEEPERDTCDCQSWKARTALSTEEKDSKESAT